MTLIVGVVENDCVIIGGCSASVGWNYERNTRLDSKVFSVGEFIFGCTTSWRMIQLLQFMFTPPTPISGCDGMMYMVSQFIPAVKSLFHANGFESVQNNVAEAGNFLVGWRGNLFEVNSDYSVSHCGGIESVGCGEQYARGAAVALREMGKSGVDLVKLTMKIVGGLSVGVYGPYKILSMKDGKLRQVIA